MYKLGGMGCQFGVFIYLITTVLVATKDSQIDTTINPIKYGLHKTNLDLAK